MLLDQNGTCYTDDVQNLFGCSFVHCSYDAASSYVAFYFDSCGYTGSSEDDCSDSIWTIEFGTITGMESTYMDIQINPVPCQSWQFNLNEFETTDLASLRSTTSSVLFAISFIGDLIGGTVQYVFVCLLFVCHRFVCLFPCFCCLACLFKFYTGANGALI